ncbi:MAG TPA: SET domain-containing protein [Rhodothermales bacterium]|nr:SET domain-containing protein [Rhodothermales bacterium]
MRYNDRVYVAACNVGRGLFATRPFSPNEHILSFHGPRISTDDPLNQSEQQSNLIQIGPREYVLPDPPGIFANHSCRPNAGLFQDTMLIAIAPIEKDEEIRFDYSTCMDEDNWTMPCACGHPECRRLITDFKTLSIDQQAWFLERNLVQTFIAEQYIMGV